MTPPTSPRRSSPDTTWRDCRHPPGLLLFVRIVRGGPGYVLAGAQPRAGVGGDGPPMATESILPRERHAESRRGFRHEALFYSGETQFLQNTVAFVRDALEHDEPILVVVGAEKVRALRGELEGDGDGRVLFAHMEDVGANPARIIPAW